MRPNNQNKRSRGRNNGSRKHSNPLSRNYESNGPDVKIRGNAAHIAEKYVQLSRDAATSSDSVMAENYLQHAEHYFRIVSAAQAAMPQRSEQPQPQTQPAANSSGDDGAETAEASTTSEAPAEEEAVASKPAPQSEDSDGGEEEPARKPRERRPRRKPRASGDSGSNPADAPQPSVGELPAFLTGGSGQTDAAE